MAKITDIQSQKKNKDRVSLFIDDDFFCGLDLLSCNKHRLKIGDEVDSEKLASAVLESECNSAFEKCMGLINNRIRTEKEIGAYLKEKQYGEDIIEKTIQKLTDYNFIDDKEFCRQYINSHRKKWGRLKIVYGLRQAGVNSDTINESFETETPQDSEAKILALKYIGNKPFDKQKLYAYLARKGFDSGIIKSAISGSIEELENARD